MSLSGKPALFAFDDLATLQLPESTFYIDPLIPIEGIVLLYGKFGTYKTPLTVAMACAIASGEEEFLGFKVSQTSPVLYLEGDSPQQVILPRLQSKAKACLAAGKPLGKNLDMLFMYPGLDLPGITSSKDPREIYTYSMLQELHRERQYKVVFVDSLRAMHHLPEVDSATVHQVYGALQKLFPGATLVLVHHERKQSRDPDQQEIPDEAFSGSQAWQNHATVGIRVTHSNRAKHEVKLFHAKSQASALATEILVRVVDGWNPQANQTSDDGYLQVYSELIQLNLSVADFDIRAAEILEISKRTAQRKRLALEKAMNEAEEV